MLSNVGLIIAGLFVVWVALYVWMFRRMAARGSRADTPKPPRPATEADVLRSRAIAMWCEVNQKIRNREARMEDLEMSFFLDDVIARPQCYRIDDKGVFHRK
jgi:hypothetical protein